MRIDAGRAVLCWMMRPEGLMMVGDGLLRWAVIFFGEDGRYFGLLLERLRLSSEPFKDAARARLILNAGGVAGFFGALRHARESAAGAWGWR